MGVIRPIAAAAVRLATSAAVIAAVSVSLLPAQTFPSGTDPRDGLRRGMTGFGTAANGMRLVSLTPKAADG